MDLVLVDVTVDSIGARRIEYNRTFLSEIAERLQTAMYPGLMDIEVWG